MRASRRLLRANSGRIEFPNQYPIGAVMMIRAAGDGVRFKQRPTEAPGGSQAAGPALVLNRILFGAKGMWPTNVYR